MIYPHWHYFTTLVDDLKHSSRYVETCRANFKTFSIEYARIILAACSEIDVVAKILCDKAQSGNKAENIDSYREIITQRFPNLATIEISMPSVGLDFIPWESWAQRRNPNWWKSYNNVKHKRDKHFEEANLENTLQSVSGLCVLVCQLYHIELASHKLTTPDFLFLGTQYAFGAAFVGQPSFHLPDGCRPQGTWELREKKQYHVPDQKLSG